jgi:hypothetical protein
MCGFVRYAARATGFSYRFSIGSKASASHTIFLAAHRIDAAKAPYPDARTHASRQDGLL